ncbi:MAG: OapB/ArvB family protein [Nanobdellota archaeon]
MLTLQYIPHTEIEHLSSEKRISKLLNLVKTDKILLVEGRLRSEEEAELIRKTMESINDKFSGIELSVVYPEDKETAFFKKVHSKFINLLLGSRRGMTIIGPANVVKEIKQDPGKIQLFTTDSVASKKSSSKRSKQKK